MPRTRLAIVSIQPRGPVTVLTDIGRMNRDLLDRAAGSKVILIEANYDRTLLMAGPYPMMLKQRICGDFGHLSNDDSAMAVADLLDRGTSQFYLYHLSEQNNYPELALLTVKRHLQRSWRSHGTGSFYRCCAPFYG